MAATAAAIVFVGCLFPGFDKFEGGAAGEGRGERDGAAGAPESGSSGTSGSSGSPDDGSSEPTPDAALPREIVCVSDGGRCPIPAQFCCTTVDGPQCQDVVGISNPKNCKIQGLGSGKAFLCDGHEDCEPGQSCCFREQEDQDGVNARCASDCAGGSIVCNDASGCRSGSCTGSVAGGRFKVCR